MRLRPRASSSDLEDARAIAERLGRPLKATERPVPAAPPYVRFGGGAPATAPAPVRPLAAPRPDAHFESLPEPVAPPSPVRSKAATAPEPLPIPEAEAEPVEAAAPTIEAEPAVQPEEPLPVTPEADALEAAPVAEPIGEEAPLEAAPEPGEAESLGSEALLAEPPIEAEAAPAASEPVGAESLVGEPAPETEPPVGAESLVEAALPGPLPAAEWEVAEEASGESPLEELSEMVSAEPQPPPPPSWDELIERAKELADAQAAMLIGPDGGLLAATDGWPAVGAAAIAAKLLPMVEPKLANPGALVPVKLAGQILSVWRFEVDEQPVTAAMLAEKALPVIVRPDIDELFAQGSLRS